MNKNGSFQTSRAILQNNLIVYCILTNVLQYYESFRQCKFLHNCICLYKLLHGGCKL